MKISVRSTGKKRKTKRKDGPKRPLSAYNFFFRDERVRILEERKLGPLRGSSDGLFSAMGKAVAKRWSDLPETERNRYEEMANADRLRYSTEMDAMVRRYVLSPSDSSHVSDYSDILAAEEETRRNVAEVEKALAQQSGYATMCEPNPGSVFNSDTIDLTSVIRHHQQIQQQPLFTQLMQQQLLMAPLMQPTVQQQPVSYPMVPPNPRRLQAGSLQRSIDAMQFNLLESDLQVNQDWRM